jgi:uncharacterized protein (DUF488 family)
MGDTRHSAQGQAVYTIGVYGFTPERFFEALESAGVRTFCDLRARRGVRGSEYAFANATRLQAELANRHIAYVHLLPLAPSNAIRQSQYAADKETHTAKRQRSELSAAFADAYRSAVLASLDPAWFLEQLGPDPWPIALFCVEREPAACHRSLVAGFLHDRVGANIHHLLP